MLDRTALEQALTALGELLADRGQHHEVIAIGGAALAILGLIERATEDLDVVALLGDAGIESAEQLPETLAEAIRDIAMAYQLAPDWMNNGPARMIQFGLPTGLVDRCIRRDYGALTVQLVSRIDQIHFKVYAAADRAPGGKHHRDLQVLQPSADELRAAAAWARTHDSSEGFLIMVRGVLSSFGVELDDE